MIVPFPSDFKVDISELKKNAIGTKRNYSFVFQSIIIDYVVEVI